MSIHRETTIHCDGCGWWEHADGESTARRRKRGWVNVRTPGRHQHHLCPLCVKEGLVFAEDGEVRTPGGWSVLARVSDPC